MIGAASVADRFRAARAVADAALYDGCVPNIVGASAARKEMRRPLGVLAPRPWVETDASERWRVHTETVVDPGRAPVVTVRVRFLQILRRTVEAASGGAFAPVVSLDAEGVRWEPCDEAVERVVDLDGVALVSPRRAHTARPFSFDGGISSDELTAHGEVVGRVVRRWEHVAGSVVVDADWATGLRPYLKVAVGVANTSGWSGGGADRDEALARSLLGVHTLLAADDGRFVSLLDPPIDAVDAVAGCRNDGLFPVLVADPSTGADVVLSSPLTLHDHPSMAPDPHDRPISVPTDPAGGG